MMLDFTSALYLGFRHAHHTLRSWAQLTTGRPAALEPAPEAERVAQDLAQLLRCKRAVLAPSTLHLYWDLFDLLARDHIAIYVDAGTYPIARWGIERAAAKGVRTATFPTHDSAALEYLLYRDRQEGFRPVVVTDGICPETGRTAPLPDYLRLVREWGGYLVVDDTQALGILGKDPAQDAPYGRGGAGTLAWYGVEGPELIIGSSLAKGFGAPLAVIAGNAELITKFQNLSATRVHTSPPSLAVISAAQRALTINEKRGDVLRIRLVKLVRHFREELRRIGFSALGGLFPVQTLRAIPDIDPRHLHSQLLSCGVRGVLRSMRDMPNAALSFLITVLHSRSDIGRCMDVLQHSRAFSCAISVENEIARSIQKVPSSLPELHATSSGRPAMSGELNFEIMPFEAYDGFRTPGGFEVEKEFGRRAGSRGVSARAPRVIPSRSTRASVSPFTGPKKPPVRTPRFRLPRWPRGAAFEPYGTAVARYPDEPPPAGSEYMRWVQSALNDVLGLQLPLNGIGDAATRSAIRSFQQREGLPVYGVVGPDTERALIAARGGGSPRDRAPQPAPPRVPEPSEQVNAPQAASAVGGFEPAPRSPAAEFEWDSFEQKLDDTRESAERVAVKDRIAAGERDPNALTDMVFFRRHPERRGQKLGVNEPRLAAEWKTILRDIVMPTLAHGHAPVSAREKTSDREIRSTLDMAAKKVPGLGITIEELLVRHQAEARGIPIEVLLAFIHFEAGRLFDDATAGKWNEKHKRYIPSFYELGVFQTPAGDHGCTNEAGVKACRYRPPGRNVENSQFGKGWRRLAGAYATEGNWKDPTMQVRIGLWDLTSTADRVHTAFADLFPSRQSEWFLRMAVLYSFAAGAGAARSFLRKFKNELLALPEAKRWDFLRGKNVGTFYFNPENVDKKMALAAKIRALRGATIAQTRGGTR